MIRCAHTASSWEEGPQVCGVGHKTVKFPARPHFKSHTPTTTFANVAVMLQLILLILALVLFILSGVLYWRTPPDHPGLAGALLAFGLAALTASQLAD